MSKTAEDDGVAESLATAKASLRDTTKWLAGSLAAFAAAAFAGTSFGSASGLAGSTLFWALAAGGFGIVCVLFAIGILLNLLTAKTFFLKGLQDDPSLKEIKDRFDEHAADVLPAEAHNIDDLLLVRDQKIAICRRLRGDPDDPQYKDASQFLDKLRPVLLELSSRVHFEVIRANLRSSAPWLFGLAMGAVIGLGAFAVLAGGAKKDVESAKIYYIERDQKAP